MRKQGSRATEGRPASHGVSWEQPVVRKVSGGGDRDQPHIAREEDWGLSEGACPFFLTFAVQGT